MRCLAVDPDDEEAVASCDPVVRRLETLGLVERDADNQVTLHRLVAAFVREQDGDAVVSVARVALELLTEIVAITIAWYPLRGQVYVSHLIALVADARVTTEVNAAMLNNLGLLLNAYGVYAAARSYLERALIIAEQMYSPSHHNTAIVINNLASLLRVQGDYPAACLLYERAIIVFEQIYGSVHPDTDQIFNSLGLLLVDMGKLMAARSYFEIALAIQESVFHFAHPATATSLNNLGLLLYTQGNLTEAYSYSERALSMRKQVLGLTHPDTAQALTISACCSLPKATLQRRDYILSTRGQLGKRFSDLLPRTLRRASILWVFCFIDRVIW
ncbi:tetratricopeptide repeat protein [Candidatus Gracilibacteria bacterium]|nr:tetratricopeptide repeat protein [Candidatus Gracilibacteria bacterium]